MFAGACGLRGPLRFMVENTETGQSQTFDVVEPFVLIGQAPGCHLRLLHPDVSFRHAYCQVLQGRLYVYDLDTESGTVWGAGLRLEGPLTPESRLQIGPFVVRLSRAPAFTCSLQPTADDWQPENEPLENVRLWFENATGRSSHNSMRPLRRQITILGRSNRCHLKLSNSSVSKTHCAIVRTEVGCWVVDLLGRNGTLLNGQPVRFAAVGPDDSLCAGRFRMRIRELIGSAESDAGLHDVEDRRPTETESMTQLPALDRLPPVVVQASPVDNDRLEQQIEQSQQSLAIHATKLPDTLLPDGARTTSDALILAMMEQFSNLQQQLLSHTQQQMSMLTEMFATLHKAQNDAVMDQLRRIQEITSELNELKAQKAVAASAVDQQDHRTASSASGVQQDDGAMEAPNQQPEIDQRPPASTSVDQKLNVSLQQPQVGFETSAASHEATDRTGPAAAADSETATRPEVLPLAEDSDVVPVTDAQPQDFDENGGAWRGAGIDEQFTVVAETSNATETDETRTHVDRLRAAPRKNQAGLAHGRLTTRISELERERKSHWKKLMQLVGGALDD